MNDQKRENEIALIASEFAAKNKHLFVIVLDAETDCMFAAYGNSQSYSRIKQKSGRTSRVVKELLYYSKFRGELFNFPGFKMLADLLLYAIAEFLVVQMAKVPEFFNWLSDMLWFVPKHSTVGEKEPLDTSAPSPTIQEQRVEQPISNI